MELGFSQEELSQLTGYKSRPHFSLIENGHRRPETEKMIRIAEILKAPVSDIFLI